MLLKIKSSGLLFYQLLFLVEIVFIVSIVMDYGKCWKSFDYSLGYYARALSSGPELTGEDLFRAFDFRREGFHYGGFGRNRCLQDLSLLVDIKFRIWLFNFLPPHPSLSWTWLFVLILSPLMMYKVVYTITLNRRAAWTGLILFCLSTGSLSGITLLCNPAKPLANFFGLWSLYLVARIDLYQREENRSPGLTLRWFAVLFTVLFMSFAVDESAWFMCFFIPVLFPAIFGRGKNRLTNLCLFLLANALLILVLLFLIPAFYRHSVPGFEGPIPPSYLVREYFSTEDGGRGAALGSLRVGYLLTTAKNLLVNQLVPWQKPWLGLAYVLIAPYLISLFLSLKKGEKSFVARSVLVLLLFMIAQALGVLSVFPVEGFALLYSYYYGAFLSIFLTIPLAMLLGSPLTKASRLVSQAVLLWLAFVYAYNFGYINEDFRRLFATCEDTGRLEYSFVLEAWRSRHDHRKIMSLKESFPIRSPWATIQELEAIAGWYSQSSGAGDNGGGRRPIGRE